MATVSKAQAPKAGAEDAVDEIRDLPSRSTAYMSRGMERCGQKMGRTSTGGSLTLGEEMPAAWGIAMDRVRKHVADSVVGISRGCREEHTNSKELVADQVRRERPIVAARVTIFWIIWGAL